MSTVEDSLNEIHERAEAEVKKLADKYRLEVLIPVCKKANMEYMSGNGTFFFMQITKKSYPYDIYDIDSAKKHNKEYLIPILEDLNCSVLNSNVQVFGYYVSDVDRKDWR